MNKRPTRLQILAEIEAVVMKNLDYVGKVRAKEISTHDTLTQFETYLESLIASLSQAKKDFR